MKQTVRVAILGAVVLGLCACASHDRAAGLTPSSQQGTVSGSDGVTGAIARIRRQTHQALPEALAVSRVQGGSSKMTIQNPTAFTLTVYIAGPLTSSVSIPQFASRTIDFPPGSYEIAAETAKPGILPLYGQVSSSSGTLYTETLYTR